MAVTILAASGIYAITNKVNGKRYIGSAVKLRYRFKEHVRLLNKGTHHSITLQRSWNKYGADAFEYSVLEIVADKSMLIECEQKWIEAYFPLGKNGYNISPTAGSPLGVKHSEKARKNMSDAHKGKTLSEEQKRKIGIAGKGRKMTPEAVAKRNASRMANGGFRQSAESYAKRTASRIASDGYKQTAEAIEKMKVTTLERKNQQKANQ